jgi:16S rRNA (adenine1518-N6/adenine1519-N6)-dimethyltransferase
VLAGRLPQTVADRLPACADRLEVVLQDALDLDSVPGPPPTAFVANLPYNVAVPVLLRLLEHLPSLRTGLVMVQAEVADRLVAPPGSRTYGIPSVKAAWYADVRRAGSIGRTVFWPAPHVDSGLVAFTRREPPAGDRLATFAVVDAAFAQRRKTLRAALAGWAGSAGEAERRLRAAASTRVRGARCSASRTSPGCAAPPTTPRARADRAVRWDRPPRRGDPPVRAPPAVPCGRARPAKLNLHLSVGRCATTASTT